MTDKEDKIENALKQIKALPEELQLAVYWLIQNIDIMTEIVQGEKMEHEEIRQLTEKALEKNDYIMLIMVLYKQISDELGIDEKT